MIVFGIEIDTRSFKTKILIKKLEKTIKITIKILAKQLITFLNILLLVRFLSFYF